MGYVYFFSNFVLLEVAQSTYISMRCLWASTHFNENTHKILKSAKLNTNMAVQGPVLSTW